MSTFETKSSLPPASTDAARRLPKRWTSLIKLAIAVIVCYFIYQAVQKGRAEFETLGFELGQIRWRWLLLASVAYVTGMLPMGLNWHRLLNAMQQRVPWVDAVRTHFISQLGKYVPGKACVPAIRFALLGRYRLHAPTTFVSMAAETLSMMAVGAFVGATIVAVVYRANPRVAFIAVGIALLSGLPIMPPVLRYVVQFLEKRKAAKIGEPEQDVSSQLTWRVLIPGWLGIVPGWFLLGLSMWATMKALNLPSTQAMTIADLPWITASYAISVVAGFASMLPGGLGVRELVIRELIAPEYGAAVGLLAAGLHRMMSLVSELLFSSILYITRPRADSDVTTR